MKNLEKLTLVYILNNLPSFFTQNKTQNPKEVVLCVTQNVLYYLSLHLKFSSSWYSTQLVDIFAYDTPVALAPSSNNSLKSDTHSLSTSNTIVVYNFHNITSHQRIFIFTWKSVLRDHLLKSTSSVFANANWLEREASEMSGIVFEGKHDLRNLLLSYGDSSAPLRKSTPSVGFKEVIYDINNDMLVQTPISLQI